MSKQDTVLQAALAGLLHDVGKFSQRAGVGMSESRNDDAKRDFGYVHALASYDFTKAFVPEAWREDLSGIAYHHRPRNQREAWIQLADHLSASEREEDEDNRLPRMLSVFSRLKGYHGDQFLPLARLNPTRRNGLFPEDKPEFSTKEWRKEWESAYTKLWDDFERECKSCGLASMTDRELYLESAFALLQDFTWPIPSAYWNNVPDVSLFDHLRTTAAIAACLAADDRSAEWCKKAKDSGDEVCLLVGGDLSGLQAFIYTLASSGAAKSLRARSFYVQLISDALALAILDDLGLPITNLLYVGGGGFQLLAPMAAQNRLPQIVQDLTDRLLTVHQGGLGLTVKWETVKYAEFGEFNKVRERLGASINHAKRQPFASASLEVLRNSIGQPLTEGGNPDKFCRVTGEDGDTVRPDKEGVYKSAFVLDLEELGRQLPKATHIAFARVPRAEAMRATGWQQALRVFGMEAQIVIEGENAKAMPLQKGEFVRVWRLDPQPGADEAQRLAPLGPTRVISYRPFAKLTPTDRDGNPLTFDDLAKPKRGSFQRWGVLRLDVDNLGVLFRDGLKNASLSRVASLSFALRLFFEGWLPELAGDDLKEHLYIQYSGGDDVFVVGTWDALPLFAQRIRQSFAEYTAGNPALALSGGMTMAEAGFPLYQAAEQAEEAEKAAKDYKRASGKEKDAFTFLGETLGWIEFAEVEKLAGDLANAIDAKQMPRAVPQTLLALRGQVKRARKPGQSKPQFGRWTWMAAYQLTRMALQTRDESAKQTIRQLQDKFLTGNMESIESIGLAARWAQYLTRGG